MRKMMTPKPVLAVYLFLVVLVTDVIVDAKSPTVAMYLIVMAAVTALGIIAAILVEAGRRNAAPTGAERDAPFGEGADMSLENGFDDVIDRMTPPDPPHGRS